MKALDWNALQVLMLHQPLLYDIITRSNSIHACIFVLFDFKLYITLRYFLVYLYNSEIIISANMIYKTALKYEHFTNHL